VDASRPMFFVSTASKATLPLLSFALWHMTQYLFSVARTDTGSAGVGVTAAAGVSGGAAAGGIWPRAAGMTAGKSAETGMKLRQLDFAGVRASGGCWSGGSTIIFLIVLGIQVKTY